MQEPALALSALQKLAQIIKEYNSNHCLDYAQVQESLGSICLITANISQAKTHFKKALKIYEDIWADEPELIEEKYKKNSGIISTSWNCSGKKVFFPPNTSSSYNACKIYNQLVFYKS